MFLWCKSVNSIFQSTLKSEDIINLCNYNFASLTDYENIFDMWNFINLAKEKGVKPVVGVELEGNLLVFLKDWEKKEIFYEIISYKALGYNSPYDLIDKVLEKIQVDNDIKKNRKIEKINGKIEDGENKENKEDKENKENRENNVIESFKGLKFVFLDETIFIKYQEIFKENDFFEFYLGIPEERIYRGDYFYLKEKYKKVVPLFIAAFKKEDFQKYQGITLFDIIISSDQKKIFKKIIEQKFIDISLRKPIFEEPTELLKLLQKIYREKANSIFDDILEFVADIDLLRNFKKNEYSFINITGSKEDDEKLLKAILKIKLKKYILFLRNFRKEEYIKRLSYEYKVIKDKNFCSYFLFVYLLTLFVKKKRIPYIGRGSAASSLVSFLLDITQVDPVKYDLFFERFLNYGREEPPDIDIDFSWKDRDYVINAIFNGEFFDFVGEFLKKLNLKNANKNLNKKDEKSEINLSFSSINISSINRSSIDRSIIVNGAMIGTRVKLGLRGAFRVVARYLGMPEPEISKYSKLIGWGDDVEKVRNRIKNILKGNKIKVLDTIFYFLEKLIGFPYRTGTHPGGFCLAPEKITKFCPIYNGVKGFRISGFDMYSIENTGLIKIDILSQRALGVFSDALKYLKNKKLFLPIEVSGIIKDKEISERLKNGDTLGCFYIESPAMRILLKQLKCKNYLELVAASSVIRPGVSQSGMKDKYIFYKNNPDKVKYIIPELKDILHETYGIMIYQEDVMKVAHVIGGLSYEKADLLRKGMSGKLRSREKMKELENDFKKGALAKGYDEQKVNLIWKYMESFAGYSFCKAHSASYATLSYKLLYLKIKYPELFYANVIGNKGGYYPTSAYVYKAVCEGVKFIKSNIKLYSTKTRVLGTIINECIVDKEKENNENKKKIEETDKIIIIGLDHLTFLNEDDLAFFAKYENRDGIGSFCSIEDFFEKYLGFCNKNCDKSCNKSSDKSSDKNSDKSNVNHSNNKNKSFEKFIKLALVGFFIPFFDNNNFNNNSFNNNSFSNNNNYCFNNIEFFLNVKKILDKNFDKHLDKHLDKNFEEYFYNNSESTLNKVFESYWEWKYYGFFIGKTPFDFLEELRKSDFYKFSGFNQKFVKKIEKLKRDFDVYDKIICDKIICDKIISGNFISSISNSEKNNEFSNSSKKFNYYMLKDGNILKIGFFITGREAFAFCDREKVEKERDKDKEKNREKEKEIKKMGFATFFDGQDFFEVVIFPDIFEDFLLKIKGSSFFLLKLKTLVHFGVETYELISIKNIFNFLNLLDNFVL